MNYLINTHFPTKTFIFAIIPKAKEMKKEKIYLTLIVITICMGFTFNEKEFETYSYQYHSNYENAVITLGEFLNKNTRSYTLEYQTHQNSGKIESVCSLDGKFIKLNNTLATNRFSITYTTKKTFDNKNLIELKFSHKIVPCWIKLEDTFMRIQSTENIKISPKNDSVSISIIPDNSLFKGFYHFIIRKGQNVFFHPIDLYEKSGFRGDLRPEIAKIENGYFKNDTLIFLGKNNSSYKFIKK